MRLQAIMLLLLLILGISGVLSYPYPKTDSHVTSALNWLRSQQNPDGSIGSFAISSWAVIAIATSEDDPNLWANSGDSAVEYLKKNTAALSSCSDYARFTLSMVAAKQDPKNVNGVNLVEKLESFFDGSQFGDPDLLNDDYWAVMALISAGVHKDNPKIQAAVAFIIANQDPISGGWSYYVARQWGVDVDSTAAAIMTLIAAGEPPGSTPIEDGLSYIKSTQDASGGFNSGWGSSAETNSWAIQAIVASGQDPTGLAWTHSSGKTPVDDLLTFQNPDGGFKDYTGASSVWTTSYAIPALLGRPYPTVRGVEVDIRLEGQASTIWKGGVFVTWSSITDKVGASHYHKDPTVIGALDEASKSGSFTYVVDYGYGSAYVTEINGDKAAGMNGWLFRVNDHTTGSYSADKYILNRVSPPPPPHTSVLWYYGGWGDKVTRITVDRTAVQQGKPFTVTVTYLDESSESWIPLEGATVYADVNYVTNSSGKVTISITNGGSYEVYAEKSGYVRSDKVRVSVSQGSRDGSNLEVNIIPALSLEVTPTSINFGTLGPGDTSQAFELHLTNSGSRDAMITVTVTDNMSTVFRDNLQISEDQNGPWRTWQSYSKSVQGHGGARTEYVRLDIPLEYPTPIVGLNTGKITFWLEPT